MNAPHLDGLNIILLYPLVAIYKALLFINFPHPLGLSIVLLTVLIRIVLWPLITSQLRASKKMQALNPKISEIRERYKGNNTMISQETMRLYKEEGVNPASGCLPVLIQLPLLWILYSVLQEIMKNPSLVTAEINRVVQAGFLKLQSPLDQSFYFLPLDKTPAQLFNYQNFPTTLFLLIPVITAALQFVQSKMMFAPPPDGQKKNDFATSFATQSTYIFPLMIGFFSATFPIGLTLYWNTFTVLGIIQQYKIAGLGGLASWKKT